VSSITAPSSAVPGSAGPSASLDEAAGQRRRTELLMLLFTFGLVVFAFANVGFSFKGTLPSGILSYVIAFVIVMLGAHLAVRRWAPYADPLLLPLAALLNGLGLVMLYRLEQSGRNGNPGQKISTLTSSATILQVMYTAVGVGCFIAVLVLIKEPRVLQRYMYTLGILGMALIALPALLPKGISEVNGAQIQVRVGSFSLQPEEFAKLCLAVFFAGYLVAKRDVLKLAGRRVLGIDLPRGRDLGPILVIWGLALLLLVFESDIGTSSLFMGLFVAMLYLATSRTSWLLIGFVLFIAGAFVTANLFGHVKLRFEEWLHPFAANMIQGNSFQLVKGLEGLGYGGVLGRGLGGGMPYQTPLVQSDFVMTGFGEELGLAGLMAILLIYGLIVQRGLRTALMVKDPFSKLLSGGLAFMMALQVFVIVGGVTRLMPLTGITTPFLSQGGSSLIGSWIVIGLFARLSDTARRPAPMPIQDEGMTQVVRLQ
jgi:cell division protein FtsW (lipid II flippase)